MSKRWVIDTSPLILLNRINHLSLLSELSEELVIPKAVADELLSYKEERVGIILLAKKKNIIPAAKPLIESLISAGLRFNEDWIKDALKLVKED